MSVESSHTDKKLSVALLYLDTDKPQRALEVLENPSTDQIEKPIFWRIRGQAHYDLGQLSQARDAIAKGLARAPEDPSLLYLLSLCEEKKGDVAAAEQAILAALRQQPENASFLCRYALLLAEGNQMAKAERLLQRAKEYEPESPSVLRTESVLAYLSGDDQRAVRLSQESLQEDPESPISRHLLGALLIEQGQVHAANRHLKAAARLDPSDSDVVDAARTSKLANHWLLWPMRPIYRWGSARIWLVSVGTMLVLAQLGLTRAATIFGLIYITFAIYSWVVPPLLKWWWNRQYGNFK